MKNTIIYPDYNHCLTNVACSILKHFKLPYKHNTLHFLDSFMEKRNYKNIIVLVYDGLGLDIIRKNLSLESFLLKNVKGEITSVFPSTTAAATTSLLSGLNPCEHGRIGYDIYFKSINKNVSIFSNTIKDTDIEAAPYNVVDTFLPYESILTQINSAGQYKAYGLFPFGKNHYQDLDDMLSQIKKISTLDQKKYIYAYYNEPDHSMHQNGTCSENTKKLIKELNIKTENFVKELNESLIIILADHGHIDTKVINLELEYPEFVKLIEGNTSIEGRACAFWVREQNRTIFENTFNSLFSKDFILLKTDEVLEKKLFGDGVENHNFEASLGDYIALGTGNRYFELHYYPDDMKAHHAGITENEMVIPLIIIEKI